MTLLVMDDLTQGTETKLFSLLGSDYVVTRMAWLNLPIMVGVGVVVALVSGVGFTLIERIAIGASYGLLVILASFVHGIGHIISSRLVGAPVKRVIVTSTVNTTDYGDEADTITRAQHIGRAIGGPISNLMMGAIMFALNSVVFPSHFLVFFGSVNLLFGAFTLMPVPSLDGAVIFRELLENE